MMKVKGSIFIDKEGIVFSRVSPDNAQTAIKDFSDMLEEAVGCGDKYYYVYSGEWEEFWLKSKEPYDNYWLGAGQIAGQLLFSHSNFVFRPIDITDSDLFDNKSLPRTHGGFNYPECPPTGYIHDKSSIDKWHYEWFYLNPDKITWSGPNKIMPCREKIIQLLRLELLDLQKHIDSDGKNNLSLPHDKFLKLKNTNWKNVDDNTIVSEHNNIILKHQGKNIKAYSEKIGSLICTANYYHEEKELRDLEKDHGNKKVSMVYSIKKEGKYQFISIDTAHGKFELCDDNGVHIGEIRFDGSSNGGGTQEDDHKLQCVAEWKQKYHK